MGGGGGGGRPPMPGGRGGGAGGPPGVGEVAAEAVDALKGVPNLASLLIVADWGC